MATITFYGGVNEIGGNKILVEDSGTRVLLDFGRRMNRAGDFYEEFIQVRSKCALLDLLKLGLLPKIDGLYPNELLDYTSLIVEGGDVSKLPSGDAADYWKVESPLPYSDDLRVDAAFISHVHFDHIQDVSFIHRNIPIHCTETAKALAKAITDVSQSGVEQQFYGVKKISIVSKNPGPRTVFPGELEFREEKEIQQVVCQKTGYEFTMEIKNKEREFVTDAEGGIGPIRYKLIPVGHSVPGACSILLTTSDGKRILYTGDIRFHGRNEPTLEEYVDKLDKDPIDVMICEGTRIESDKELTEEDVYKDVRDRVKETKGLVLIDFGWKDTTRFDTISRVAQDTGRTFVISPKHAYLLYELHKMDPVEYGDPTKMEHVKVYKKRQENRLYAKQDYDKFKAGYLEHWGRNSAKADKNIVRIAEKLGVGGEPNKTGELTPEEKKAWELATHHIEKGIPAYEIRKNPDKYILMFSFWDANELLDLSTPEGKIPDSFYIRASCEPFNDEMKIDEKKLMNWLNEFEVYHETEIDEDGKIQFKRAHVSGHASRPELKKLIEGLRPKILIPIHTEKPEMFRDFSVPTKIVVEGEEYNI